MKNKVKYPDKYSDEFVKFLDENFIIQNKEVFDFIKEDSTNLKKQVELIKDQFGDVEILLNVKYEKTLKKKALAMKVITQDLPEDIEIKKGIIQQKLSKNGAKILNNSKREVLNQFSEDEFKIISGSVNLLNGNLENFLKFKTRSYIQSLLDIIRYLSLEFVEHTIGLLSVPNDKDYLDLVVLMDKEKDNLNKKKNELVKFLETINEKMEFTMHFCILKEE